MSLTYFFLITTPKMNTRIMSPTHITNSHAINRVHWSCHTYRWRTSDVPNLWHAWPVDTGQPKWNSVLRNGPGETFGGCFCLKTEENIPKFYFYYLPPIFLIFVIFLTFTARKIAKLSKTWCHSINHFWQFRFLYLALFRTLTVFPQRYTFYF